MSWADAVNRAVADSLSLSKREMLVPLGETRTLKVLGKTTGEGNRGGSLRPAWRVEVADGGRAVSVEIRGRDVIVRGLAVGVSEVRIRAGDGRTDKTVACRITVKQYAGSVRQAVHAAVTGTAAPPKLCEEAAAFALRRYLPREPGASITLVRPIRSTQTISPGQEVILTARVRIAGSGFIPIEGEARVIVRNVALAAQDARVLLYSNNPERIRAYGTLFSSIIQGDAPVRLFYHHVNNLSGPVALTVTLVNPSDRPVSLQLVPGFALPDVDPIRAGHNAGRAFFKSYRHNLGEIYSLPPRSSVLLGLDRLGKEETGSGIAEVRLIDAGDVRCAIQVDAERWSTSQWDHSLADKLDVWRWAHARPASAKLAETSASPHVFPVPIKRIHAAFAVGGTWTWIRIGQEPITAENGSLRLDGNYGVVYRISIEMRNPYPQQRTVNVAFDAGAGPANAVFLVGDRYVDLTGAYAGGERQVAQFSLAPHETRNIEIETMPLGGGFYPASLVVR